MGQESDVWRTETNLERERTHGREKDEDATGRDLPNADGTVSQEDMDAIGQKNREGKPTGQDHSLDNYGETFPDHGVGAVQNENDPTSDVARIDE
jgi:hypothetical protein